MLDYPRKLLLPSFTVAESTSLLFLLLLVELPVLTMSRPTPVRPHKAGLTKLYHQMRWLTTVVHGVVVSLMWFQYFTESF